MLSAPFAELVKEVPPASPQGEAGLGERSGEVRGASDLSKLGDISRRVCLLVLPNSLH